MGKAFFGFYFGVAFCVLVILIFPGKNYEDMQKAIKDCEASLPRDQHCVVRAEPVLKENK